MLRGGCGGANVERYRVVFRVRGRLNALRRAYSVVVESI
jgi:hypothetical protein